MILPCLYCFEINTPLHVEEISAILEQSISRDKPSETVWGVNLRPAVKRKSPFYGTVTANGFSIRRVLNYYTSFEPYITGSYKPDHLGTTVRIRMSIHPLAMSLVVFYFAFVILIAFPGTFEIYHKLGRFEFGLMIPVVMLLGGLAITQGSFWSEATKSRRLLIEMFDTHRVKSSSS